ncbi:MAG: hypothetical protein SFZ23_11875 [Planctomycetota bacterium]|nr:hypothetical protein [Planctomycetota bacterium]
MDSTVNPLLGQSPELGAVTVVIDVSGPMVGSLDYVRSAMVALERSERIEAVIAVNARGVSRYNPTDSSLVEWLATLRPGGRQDVTRGLLAALHDRPRSIVLVTRSIARTNAPDPTASITEALDRANPLRNGKRSTFIRAVQLVDDDPAGWVRAIGQSHGEYVVLPMP